MGELPTRLGAVLRLRRGEMLVSLMVLVVSTAVLIPLIVGLWPSPDASDRDFPVGTTTSVEMEGCAESTDEVPCGSAMVLLDTGEEIEATLYRDAWLSQLDTGDRIVTVATTAPGGDSVYEFQSVSRGSALIVTLVILALVVTVILGLRGLRAAASLLTASVFIWFFIVRGISDGGDPLVYTSVGGAAIITGVLFFTHGLSLKTCAAWAGTLTSTALAMVLGWVLTTVLKIGQGSDSSIALTNTGLDISLPTLSLAALLITLVGILNDITAAQAATVASHLKAPGADLRQVLSQSLSVGRDHASSAIYTVAFSVAGAGLASFVLAQTYRIPLDVLVQSDEVATTVVQMTVGIVGVTIAMPLTTLIAVWLGRDIGADTRGHAVEQHHTQSLSPDKRG